MGNLVQPKRHRMALNQLRYYCQECGAYTYTFSVAVQMDGKPCDRGWSVYL